MANIILINPCFSASFWSMTHSLPILGRQAVIPTAALALLAALTPAEHEVRIFDEAVEPIDYDEVARADIVGLTGMVVQRERMREIAGKVKAMGKFLAVGGPWITVQEDYLQGLADVIFVGEAEQTWPVFLRDWAAGGHQIRYEQSERTDMASVPAQRLDLLKLDRYLQGSLQISRGCPYRCEFCDIIVTFGRQPRVKTADQVIGELDAWYRAGIMAVFLVDDNIIGNRKALLPILDRLAQWQRQHGYLVSLHTEASINLADDEELLDKFVEANIRTVFVGIETPNPAALMETKKFQNVDQREQREGFCQEEAETFLLQRIHKIQRKGIKVTCGLIVGFDSDPPDIFDVHRRFLARSGIMHAMVGLLSAIPKTPLYERLKAAGRLDEKDPPDYGTNVIPANMSREQLARGYTELMRDAYEPDAYFDRLDDLYIRRRFYDNAEAVRVPNIPRCCKPNI
ncbi:B12-binding domain-containing radical SAM protein [Methylogaea oryzae]|uniref:B12-binding domain-containing radical SAM protein n=1 Tax=Methylogaea oryzae TaxID=1295382 RepID=UPI000A6EA949|nr:radical SAM protein [Methylogaea oryzae]